MEAGFRAALLVWLAGDPALAAQLNIVAEEDARRPALPWLALVASASVDWGTKTRAGREIRLALELRHRGDATDSGADLARAVETRALAMPRAHPAFALASIAFLRGRASLAPGNIRTELIELTARILASDHQGD